MVVRAHEILTVEMHNEYRHGKYWSYRNKLPHGTRVSFYRVIRGQREYFEGVVTGNTRNSPWYYDIRLDGGSDVYGIITYQISRIWMGHVDI